MDISSAIEAILFAAGESVPVDRLSLILDTPEDEVLNVAMELAERYSAENRGIRLLKLENKLQLCIIGIFVLFTVLIFILCIASMTGSANILF